MEEAPELVIRFRYETLIGEILSSPVRALTWIVLKIRTRMYDPEKVICPGCGFRGDSGTAKKTCRIKLIRTMGNERASIEHNCFRCSAQFFTQTFRPANSWMAPLETEQATRIKQAAARTEL